MQLIVHRGTEEIGGTVVELKTDKTRLLLDIGQPLSKKSKNIDISSLEPDAVIISHPHQDHFGLIDQLDDTTRVFIGELGKNLICASRKFLRKELPRNSFHHFEKWLPFDINEFKITPYLMDHSAVDSYAFLIEAQGKRIFYSGDFRATGNKGFLFDKLLNDPPPDIDILLLEGTMMRRTSGRFPDESSVRRQIISILKDQQNITFLIASSQNIDRLVSAIYACQKTSKILVLDIYTAWVLEQVSQISDRVPNMEWDQVKIYADFRMDECVANDPEFFKDFRRRLYKHRVTKEELRANPEKYLYYSKMSRFRNMELYKQFGPINVIYSQWLGYLDYTNDDYYGAEQISAYQSDPLVNFTYTHTSGHADLKNLKKLAEKLNPLMLVPIHTEHPADFTQHFDNVKQLKDGQPFDLS